MNWIVKHAVSIAFIRACLVTIACIVYMTSSEYNTVIITVITICLLTIPMVELARKKVKEHDEF